jgi:hypothetical protein
MSRLVERIARTLAQPARATPPGEPPHTDTTLITRRQASRRAAAGALTITTATALGPSAGNAAAAGYCFSQCVNHAEANLSFKLDDLRGFATPFHFIGLSQVLAAAAVAGAYGGYYDQRSQCYQPKCGDPKRYPPPPPAGGTQGCPSGCVDCGAAPPGTYCACGGAVCCACGKECSYAQYCIGCCDT